MTAKTPATVITGFLGVGKTTLIQHLLAHAHGRRLALIINEFGDLGVDGEIVRGCGIQGCAEDDVLELSNGCICCTVAEDFIPAMEKLLNRAEPPEHIIIETSGLALPQPLVRAFNWPEIRNRVTVDGVVTVIDSAAVQAGRFAQDEAAIAARRKADDMLDHDTPLGELFADQIACADMIILNKTDLLAAEDIAALEARLKGEARPGVRFVRAQMGAVSPATLLGLGVGAENDMAARHGHHHHDHDHDHDHDDDHHHHDHDDFATFQLDLPAIDDADSFAARIRQVIIDHDILRLKGFAQVGSKPMRLVIQAVGPRVAHYFDRPLREAEKGKTLLVVIGKAGLDAGAIRAALQG